MIYYKHCPKCGIMIKGKHSEPTKVIASPFMTCSACGIHYIDKDKVEWALVPMCEKFMFLLGNGRGLIMLFTELVLFVTLVHCEWTVALLLLICVTVFLVLTFLFGKYVMYAYADQIKASYERAEDGRYVDSLIRAGYPVKKSIGVKDDTVFSQGEKGITLKRGDETDINIEDIVAYRDDDMCVIFYSVPIKRNK